jgi:hypothetical protein
MWFFRSHTAFLVNIGNSDRQDYWKARQHGGNDQFITQDFPVEIQQRSRTLIPILSAAKSMHSEQTVTFATINLLSTVVLTPSTTYLQCQVI